MPEYIDKDVLIERIKHIQTWWTCTDGSYFGPPVRVNYDDVISAIESAPPADVSPIVCCKECKYAGEPQTPPYLLRRPDTLKCKCGGAPCVGRLVSPNDFCRCGTKGEDI